MDFLSDGYNRSSFEQVYSVYWSKWLKKIDP